MKNLQKIAVLALSASLLLSGFTVSANEAENETNEPLNENQLAMQESDGEETNALENNEMYETENPIETADIEETVEQAESCEEPVELLEFKEIDMNGLEAKVANGVLTISGNGVVEGYNYWIEIEKKEITSIIIGEGVTEIGDHAFDGYENLEQVSIPNSVTRIGSYAFRDCSSLSNISIPNSVREIGESAFLNCSSLSNISIPDSVREIGESAFYGSGLISVSIPGGVTEIQDSTFSLCKSLVEVFISDGVTKIGDSAFRESSSLVSVSVPESVKEIGSYAFELCTDLKEIHIPDGISEIRNDTFWGCHSLRKVIIPNSVTKIESGAFTSCYSLSGIVIPDSVQSIGYTAFYDCRYLLIITFKGNAPEISEVVGIDDKYEPFGRVSAAAYYPSGNPTYTEELKAAYGSDLIWEETKEMPEMSFTDVNKADWYYNAADYVFSRGIMTGMNDSEFGPSGRLSRAQFATILYRIHRIFDPRGAEEEYDAEAFPDVKDGQFYTSSVMWAKNYSIIKGYEDGRFGPADEITREQMAVIMYRYAYELGLGTSAEGDMSVFPDAGKVSAFAEEEMKWAIGKGLITGDRGNINPQGTAERAQCAIIIQRFMEAYGL